jgi:uncharacterized surface protein with fasciclin (FAS1) repeats
MMRTRIHIILLTVFIGSLIFQSCKKWDDHNAITDPALTRDLYQQIQENSSLSKFAELLAKSGYDKVLASSKTFTVYAPTNAALANLDAAIINDSARLAKFIGSHIASQSYFTTDPAAKRIEMLNGKFHNIQGKTIEDAAITTADDYARNGVVQVIDKMLPVLDNAWETMKANAVIPAAQKAYLLSLFQNVFDASHAVQIGVNPVTGEPVYQPGTDSVQTNLFWRNVYDLREENKQYTFFVLTDAAWNTEVTKFKPFLATGSVDSTTRLSSWEVVKDFAVEGLYLPNSIPDTLVSRYGVKIPVNRNAIVQTIRTSNGIIYVMNQMDVQPKDKIKGFQIEGEYYRTTSADRRGNTYFRDRFNPVTGRDFRDILVFGHGIALFNINYRISNVYSMKYKAYWVAVNDFQTASFNQKLAIGSPTAATFAYTAVPANNYNEVYIGEFTQANYQSFLDLYLVAANSTTTAVNPLVCDYIKLVPSF